MLEKQKLWLLLFLVPMLLFGCKLIQGEENSGCIPPSELFTVADLIGTWATELPGQTDTLIIREDGLYKQIVHIERPSFDYEGEWLPWRIEYKESGIPYLHLESMRMCVYFDGMDCEQVGGGEHYWKDFCRDEWIQTPGEGVLMVLGVPERVIQPPRGFELVALGKHIEGVAFYQLQEP